jgi:hypothetical protein
MATISSFKINGQENLPPREWQNLEVNATFDNDSVQANINFSALNFVDQSNEVIKDWFFNNVGATEGIPFEITVNNYIPFSGYLDWNTYKVKGTNESEMSLVKTNSLNGVSERAQGISMLLLQNLDANLAGAMPTSMGVNIPYLIENRKTLLENLQLIGTAFITVKSGIDEVFKFINISADITTLGIAQALINLSTTILNLVVIINSLVEQLKAIQKALFPLVRYHRGIKLKTFLEQGAEYMGYTLDTGTGAFNTVLENVVLCPHKTDEEGAPVGFFGAGLNFFQSTLSGILKPNDYGYTLSEAFDLCNKLFYTKVAVSNGVIKLLPYNDFSWTLNPAYNMSDIRIEDSSFTSNGIQSYNVDELKGRTFINYADDDSDKHTITDVNDSFSETIVSPITVNDTRNVLIKGVDSIEIPYALCVRKNALDELFEAFQSLVGANQTMIADIKEIFETLSDFFDQGLESNNNFLLAITLREGAMKVENHFFSTPKIVYLENDKIPTNFTDKVGAVALYNNYHSYKSFVSGIKDPTNLNNTNQKKIFTDVRIPFGAESFAQIINNSFFNDSNGNLSKFTSVNWNVDGDFAIVSYYTFEKYIDNLIEVTV